MTDSSADADDGGLPSPTIHKRSGPSLVWLVPLITLLVGGWLIFKTLSDQGPEITLTFKTAEGIEAGKTKIKYKNLEIGLVESLRFSDDFSQVVLSARMSKAAEPFLRRDTRFWVVKPRLGLRGVSGLSTLISGAFIEIEPGKGAIQHHFNGLETPPLVKAEEAGKRISLIAERLGSIDIGSPIYYQGILAGEVHGYELGSDRKSVFIHAFVKEPFDKLVRGNTRFWNVSGVDLTVGSEGVEVRTESVQSLLFGGIAFDTPASFERASEDVEGLVFTLHDDRESIEEKAYTKKMRFVLFFEGSVRGLNIGAPVEFKGIKVGSVTDVRLEFDSSDTSFRIPVLVEIEPERVIERGDDDTAPYQTLKTLVERGLRARLQTGSLLTGQLFVELDMHPETPVRLVDVGGEIPELPTIPGSFDELAGSIKGVLTKLEEIDFGAIGRELEGTLHGSNVLLNAPELKASIVHLRDLLGKLDRRADPLGENIELAAKAAQEALRQLNAVLKPDSPLQHHYIQVAEQLDTLLKPDSPLQYQYIQMAEELSETARSIRNLVDHLERNPESLIFGKNPGGR